MIYYSIMWIIVYKFVYNNVAFLGNSKVFSKTFHFQIKRKMSSTESDESMSDDIKMDTIMDGKFVEIVECKPWDVIQRINKLTAEYLDTKCLFKVI